MVHIASGTLESSGLNKPVPMDANCRELGYTSMTDNINTSPNTTRPKASNPGASSSPLVNDVNVSSDTSMMDFPSGTVESRGLNE